MILESAPRSPESHSAALWVDPSRECSVQRYILSMGGKVRLQLNIDYTRDEQYGFVPSAWEIARLDPGGNPRESVSASVVSFVLNRRIPVEEFQLNFPAGTLVTDLKSDSARGRTQYIVREEGAKRLVTEEETFNASYEQLLNTETGMALGVQPPTTRKYLAGLLIGALIVVLALTWRQVRRGRNRGVS